MTIIKRSDLNRPLTWSELDSNFEQVDGLVTQAASAVQVATSQAQSAQQSSAQAASASSDAQDARDEAVDAASSAAASAETAVSPVRNNTREIWSREIADIGGNLVSGSFEEGGALSTSSDVLWHQSGAQCYTWAGTLPKVVPAGSTPQSSGGINASGWVTVKGRSLRNTLATTAGANMVGYNSSVTPVAGTVGEALGPFKATGGTRAQSKEVRASQRLSVADYTEITTDAGAAANAAIARIRSEANPSYPDSAGGEVHFPRGRLPATTPITIDLIPGVGGLGISLKGEGTAATYIDYQGAAVDGVVGNAATGPLYGHIQDMTFANARSAIRLLKGSRLRIQGVEAYLPSSDGFHFENLIMTEVSNCFVTGGSSHAFRYTGDVSETTSQEKTSIFHHNNWARNSPGRGHDLSNMSYSVSLANGVDNGGSHGYYISGISYGLTSLGDGAESCQGTGWLVEAIRATDDIKNFRIMGGYARGNNKGGGNASAIGVKAANGGKATVIIDGFVNKPQAGIAGGECVIVNGDGAVARIHGNSDLPNSFRSTTGGYIDFTPVTIPVMKNIATGVATPVVSLLSSQGQGHGNRYAGKIFINARNAHPSATGNTNIAFYELTICKTDTGNPNIVLNGEYGYAILTGATDKTAWPSFTWTLNTTTNQLTATPKTGVGGTGTDFYFEVETSRTLYALPV